MIFSFTTSILTDCARGASDRSGFRPVPAVMLPNCVFLPTAVLSTCGGLLPKDSARRLFFFDQPSHAAKHVRDGFVKAYPSVSVFQNIPLLFVEFTSRVFQWKQTRIGKVFQTVTA